MAGKLYERKKVDLGKSGSFTVKKGAMTAMAQREGVSNSEFEQEHKNDPKSSLAGRRARTALGFKAMK